MGWCKFNEKLSILLFRGENLNFVFHNFRVACFRDDIVFLIYLYQRWLYPVDQTRIDCSGMIEETCHGENTEQKVVKNTEQKNVDKNSEKQKVDKNAEQKNVDKNVEKLAKKPKPNKKKDWLAVMLIRLTFDKLIMLIVKIDLWNLLRKWKFSFCFWTFQTYIPSKSCTEMYLVTIILSNLLHLMCKFIILKNMLINLQAATIVSLSLFPFHTRMLAYYIKYLGFSNKLLKGSCIQRIPHLS